MRAIINYKLYDTETAACICDLACNARGSSDFAWHDTKLYRSPKGTFFIAGQGGPTSMWGRSIENAYHGGSGLRLVTVEEAREYMEGAGCDEDDYEHAGLGVEEG